MYRKNDTDNSNNKELTLSKTSYFAYECAKEGVFIDFTSSLLMYTVFGPGGVIAIKASLISATFYTGSCLLGKVLEDYYDSPYGLIVGRGTGNAGKYFFVTSYLKYAATEAAKQHLLFASNEIAATVTNGDNLADSATAVHSTLTDFLKTQGTKEINIRLSYELTNKCLNVAKLNIGEARAEIKEDVLHNQDLVHDVLKEAASEAKQMPVLFTVCKGFVNGALYGCASKFLPLEQNIAAAIPIEAVDSLLGEFSAKSGFTGVMVGSFLVYDVTKFVEYNGAIDDAFGNVTQYFADTLTSGYESVKGISELLPSINATEMQPSINDTQHTEL